MFAVVFNLSRAIRYLGGQVDALPWKLKQLCESLAKLRMTSGGPDETVSRRLVFRHVPP
jgi:hypothetical protein